MEIVTLQLGKKSTAITGNKEEETASEKPLEVLDFGNSSVALKTRDKIDEAKGEEMGSLVLDEELDFDASGTEKTIAKTREKAMRRLTLDQEQDFDASGTNNTIAEAREEAVGQKTLDKEPDSDASTQSIMKSRTYKVTPQNLKVHVPTSIGRPKGPVLSTVGLRRKTSNNTRPVAFRKKEIGEKLQALFNWLRIEKVIFQLLLSGQSFIKAELINKIDQRELKDSFMDKSVDVKILSRYCEGDALVRLKEKIKLKKKLKCTLVTSAAN